MKYKDIFLPYIRGEYIEDEKKIICECPFCRSEYRAMSINKKNGVFYCSNCNMKGNSITFLGLLAGLTHKEAYKFINRSYTFDDYYEQYKIDSSFLKLLDIKETDRGIEIPFFNADNELLAIKVLQRKESKWKRESIAIPYGLWKIAEFNNTYIIVTETENDVIACWYNKVQAVAFPEMYLINEKNVAFLDKFEKIYLHNSISSSSRVFIRKMCQVLPLEKLYTIASHSFASKCYSIANLQKEKLLTLDNLLETAQQIDKQFYDEVNTTKDLTNNLPLNVVQNNEVEKHIEIADKVMNELYIYYYKENFYIYDNGVYKRNLPKIEQCILEIEPSAKSHLRNEVLDYIRIKRNYQGSNVNEQFINFRNGLYNLENRKFIKHSPLIFTTCQINARYYENITQIQCKEIDTFLDDVTCGKMSRKQALLQYVGYSMTYRTNLATALILYGPTAKNGKSTTIELINKTIGLDNVCHITLSALGLRFGSASIVDKLLNTETELGNENLSNMEIFKKIVSGDEMSVEEKYKNVYTTKPFCKLIYGTNTLPNIINDDDGVYRRLNIIPYEKQFSYEEERAFDKNKILTSTAIDYFANLALRAYLNMTSYTNKFANYEENKKLISNYRAINNSVAAFINDEDQISSIFDTRESIKNTEFYKRYCAYCLSNKYYIKNKKEFYKTVEANTNYRKVLSNGYECYKYLNHKIRTI